MNRRLWSWEPRLIVVTGREMALHMDWGRGGSMREFVKKDEYEKRGS